MKIKSPKKADKDLTSLSEELLQELFVLMGVEAIFKVSWDEEGQSLAVTVDAPNESGLIIGYHGETLSAIQSFLSMAIKQRQGEWVRASVDIAGYREKQEEKLIELAKQTADRAKETHEPQPLYNLTPGQRRVIHLALSDDKDIETKSEGEAQERYLVIKTKK